MKPGKRVYAEVRTRRLAYVRRNLRRLVVLLVGWMTVGSLVFFLFSATVSKALAYFFAGAWLVGAAWLVSYFLLLEGSLYRRMGGTAEQWTAEAFGKLRRHGWTAFHNVHFSDGDVDHVVIGPRQVLAVETKYTTRRLEPDPTGFPRVPDSWLHQAQRRARKVRLLLQSEQEVTPVLVLWGPNLGSPEHSWMTINGVPVLIGARVREWSAGLRKREWSRQPTHQARRAVEDYVRRTGRGSRSAVRVLGI